MKYHDPIALFGKWFSEANDAGLPLPEAMTLATCTADGYPSSRTVLLKHFDQKGFTFYTNFNSRKSSEIERNSHVALLFHWAKLERQVRIEGTASRVSRETAAAYFATRPRGSQISAWASRQSSVLPDRATLEARIRKVEAQYVGEEVPLPPFWGGWCVAPNRMEFWRGRPSRRHDRLVYTRQDNAWRIHQLYP